MHTCALGKNLDTETEQMKGITKDSVLSTVTLGSNCIYPKQNVMRCRFFKSNAIS